MSAHPYHTIVNAENVRTLTILPNGEKTPIVVNGDHPNYDRLVKAAKSGAPVDDLKGLANIALGIEQGFQALTERIAIKGETILLDGDPIHGALADHIVRVFTEGDGAKDCGPVLQFLEKIATNPSERSQEQLFSWLSARNFTITDEGDFIAYKGVKETDGKFFSQHQGPAIVDGKEHQEGFVPNEIGSTITIARSKVDDNPRSECSTGLHVGSHDYASSFGQSATLKVLVNPRDVVSVPAGERSAKVRVCRYKVLDTIKEQIKAPVVAAPTRNAPAPDPKARVKAKDQVRVQPTGLPAFKIKKGQTIHEKGKKDRPNKTITKVGRDYIECDNNSNRPISKANVHKRYELIKDVS